MGDSTVINRRACYVRRSGRHGEREACGNLVTTQWGIFFANASSPG
ncbi:MAG: hypothetical protein AB8G18_16695 [Gammaproteobacteria bacterium]